MAKKLIKMWKVCQTHTKKNIEKMDFLIENSRYCKKKIAPRVRKIDEPTFLSVKMFWETVLFMLENDHT